jgi:energy-coupling factor transporter ATP-binding protein EcfA2
LPSNTELIQEITDKVLEQIDLGNITPMVLIDGRSNSGKSTFAKSLRRLSDTSQPLEAAQSLACCYEVYFNSVFHLCCLAVDQGSIPVYPALLD